MRLRLLCVLCRKKTSLYVNVYMVQRHFKSLCSSLRIRRAPRAAVARGMHQTSEQDGTKSTIDLKLVPFRVIGGWQIIFDSYELGCH